MKTLLPTLALVLALLASCQFNHEQDEWGAEKNKRDAVTKSLALKHGITQDWDTLGFKWDYSIDLQDAPSNLFVCGRAHLHDIMRVDSSIQAVISMPFSHGETYISLKVTSEQVRKLRTPDAALIYAFRLDRIRKVGSTAYGMCEEEEGHLVIEASQDFIGSGELIDVVSIPRDDD